MRNEKKRGQVCTFARRERKAGMKKKKKQSSAKSHPSTTTTRCTIRKRARQRFWWYGGTTYLAIRIHCTRHHKVVNASHTPTVLWLINHSKKSKTPLMILAFTKKKKPTWKDEIAPGPFRYFFHDVWVERSFHNPAKNIKA